MRLLISALLAALVQPSVPMAQLLLVRLGSGDIALNTSHRDLEFQGVMYRGAAGLGAISVIKDGAGEVQGLQLELNGGDASALAIALDGGDEFQGSPVIVRTAVLNADTYKVVDAPIEWSGYGDTFALEEDGTTASIKATAESDQVDLLRGKPLTASDADHQSVFPGDRAFEYRQSQVGQPVVWPSKEFFYQ